MIVHVAQKSFWKYFQISKYRKFFKNQKFSKIFKKFQKTVTLRIMHRISRNRVSGYFGGGGSPSWCQKFRQHFLSEISATISKMRFCFSKFGQNRHFRFFILARKGMRLVKNFCLVWSALIRSKSNVKPHGRSKSRTRPPHGVTNLFSFRSMNFWWNFMIQAWTMPFWPRFEMLFLREYFIKFHETVSSDISGGGRSP